MSRVITKLSCRNLSQQTRDKGWFLTVYCVCGPLVSQPQNCQSLRSTRVALTSQAEREWAAINLSTSNPQLTLALSTAVARVNGLTRPLSHGPLSRPVTASPLCVAETLRQDTKWLGDSHCGQAMDVLVTGWDTSLWLGRWSNIHYWERVNKSQQCLLAKGTQLDSIVGLRMKKKCLWRQR
jgi:hypothetical protein